MSVKLTEKSLSVSKAYDELEGPGLGGIVLFIGRVRPDRKGLQRVEALLYEAHRPLALAAFRKLERDARQRLGASRVVIWHRLGRLPVGTASVIIGVAMAHRAAAFAACRTLIDRLKREVPLWKVDQVRPGRRRRKLPSRSAGR